MSSTTRTHCDSVHNDRLLENEWSRKMSVCVSVYLTLEFKH